MTVPEAATSPVDDDPFGFDMSAMAAGDAGDDWESGMPAPVKKPAKKKKGSSKSRSRSRSSGSGTGAGKSIGAVASGVITLLVLAGIGFRIANRINGGGFGLGFGVNWSSYTTPGGEVSFDVPGTVKSQAGGALAAPGAMIYLGESRQFACGVIIEPKPIEMQGFSEEDSLAFLEPELPTRGATNVRRTSINGRTALAYDMSRGEFSSHCTGVVSMNAFYTFVFLYKDTFDADAESRFLGSIQVNQ